MVRVRHASPRCLKSRRDADDYAPCIRVAAVMEGASRHKSQTEIRLAIDVPGEVELGAFRWNLTPVEHLFELSHRGDVPIRKCEPSLSGFSDELRRP